MEFLKILSGPLVGAVIGYFTNYLAVKMLFHPYREVKIGSITLPFTPGIIPKRRGHLAKALGQVVGNELLTGDDLKGMLLSEEMEEQVADRLVLAVKSEDYSSFHRLLVHFMEEEAYQERKGNFSVQFSELLCQQIEKLNIGGIIAEEGAKAVKEKTQGTMLEMFLNDRVIASVAEPIGESVGTYIKEHGSGLIGPMVAEKVDHYTEKPFTEILTAWQIDDSQIRHAVQKAYHHVVDSQLEKAMEKLNIAQIVEEKINGMELPQLEQLLLSVMKKELTALVNLGAVIGFVIGILNCFI